MPTDDIVQNTRKPPLVPSLDLRFVELAMQKDTEEKKARLTQYLGRSTDAKYLLATSLWGNYAIQQTMTYSWRWYQQIFVPLQKHARSLLLKVKFV